MHFISCSQEEGEQFQNGQGMGVGMGVGMDSNGGTKWPTNQWAMADGDSE